jgi:hypothetical protein
MTVSAQLVELRNVVFTDVSHQDDAGVLDDKAMGTSLVGGPIPRSPHMSGDCLPGGIVTRRDGKGGIRRGNQFS